MTTYKDSGVDVQAGDDASRAAYEHASSTFASRQGRVGMPVMEEDGYAGLLDMGEYYVVQTSDGTGSKMALAVALNRYDTLGRDLLAMVADDAVCTGAEVIAVGNTIDVPAVEKSVIDGLMTGLAAACKEQHIVIPSGEIAEVPGAVREPVWNATALGIVAKDRVIAPETIISGDIIVSLKSAVARSNGFTLIRSILQNAFAKDWVAREWKDGITWGEIMLTPSIIYADAVLSLIGRYGEPRAIPVKGIAHITGGGIPGKLGRVLKKSGCGAMLDGPWSPHPSLIDLMTLGAVETQEAYRTWNMGNGMMLIMDGEHAEQAIAMLGQKGIEARVAGSITQEAGIRITAHTGEELAFGQ